MALTITISLTQLLRGVYADAALMSATGDMAARPALLRHEHELALRRTAVSAWATLMADIVPFAGVGTFSSSDPLGDPEPDFLTVELTGDRAGKYGAAMRLQLETALERRILAIAYRTCAPEASRANDALAEMALVALKRMCEPEGVGRVRGWE